MMFKDGGQLLHTCWLIGYFGRYANTRVRWLVFKKKKKKKIREVNVETPVRPKEHAGVQTW